MVHFVPESLIGANDTMVLVPIRCLFLDFGGTLVEPDVDPYPDFHATLLPLGIDVSPERYAEAERRASARVEPLRYLLIGQKPSFLDRGNIELLQELGVPDPDGRIASRLHEVYTSPSFRRSLPDTVEALTALRRVGLPLHLVSNSSDMLLETISRRGWSGFFESVTFSQEVGAEKPDRRVFDFALERAGCAARDVVHVGDSWRADYQGAMEAGLRAIWFNRAGLPAPAPCEVICSLKELPEYLAIR